MPGLISAIGLPGNLLESILAGMMMIFFPILPVVKGILLSILSGIVMIFLPILEVVKGVTILLLGLHDYLT